LILFINIRYNRIQKGEKKEQYIGNISIKYDPIEYIQSNVFQKIYGFLSKEIYMVKFESSTDNK
jgi:hypothetical protein